MTLVGLSFDIYPSGYGGGADAGIYYVCCTGEWGLYGGTEGSPGFDTGALLKPVMHPVRQHLMALMQIPKWVLQELLIIQAKVQMVNG